MDYATSTQTHTPKKRLGDVFFQVSQVRADSETAQLSPDNAATAKLRAPVASTTEASSSWGYALNMRFQPQRTFSNGIGSSALSQSLREARSFREFANFGKGGRQGLAASDSRWSGE
jgi:hypothetical protein